MTSYTVLYKISFADVNQISGGGSVWLERYLREVEAASSNLVTPIEKDSSGDESFLFALHTGLYFIVSTRSALKSVLRLFLIEEFIYGLKNGFKVHGFKQIPFRP